MIENLEVPCSLETGQDFLKVDIYLDPKLACFRGHFPAQPLLPGIMQIQFVLEYACKLLGKRLHIASIPQLKFIYPVLPGQTLRLDLRKRCTIPNFRADICINVIREAKFPKISPSRRWNVPFSDFFRAGSPS